MKLRKVMAWTLASAMFAGLLAGCGGSTQTTETAAAESGSEEGGSSAEGGKVLRTEGHDGKRWVLLDYGSVIVHVFTQEAHDYYDLEHLWADATVVPASEWMPDEGADEQ